MKSIEETITGIDWDDTRQTLSAKGYALVPSVLNVQHTAELINNYDHDESYRKTVVMERYRFGLGEYRYFSYPLPSLIETIRTKLYPQLVPVANSWMQQLNIEKRFPSDHQ